MSRAELNEEAVFDIARHIEDPGVRKDYVEQACATDPALNARVNELLKLHDEEASFLESPPEGMPPTVEMSQVAEKVGQTIGHYTLREQIGEGGMGVVYVAQQEKPLLRKVALKVIKPGMDSKSVLARFDAERNALALMNHPNIARVLDAGATEQGHPYFVMELIQGKPITEYCDEKKLTIGQRLELFTQVCNAVQHAHQKGVIHRDIKPSNILVTEIDGKPVPKVIDFGVAKALGANLTERTIYTSFQALVGTPLYMSPEQTQLSGVDVDTSSDVYSLGILLYELLTGTTPLSPEELRQAAQDEVLRRIRETEPPRPSNRINSLGETSTRVSACRGTGPADLGRLVRGDLDWIVMRALEKDRNRRYKTADAFAADIGRHLANEPVEARPPSTAYRLSRLCRRNRVVVGVLATLFSVAVVAAVVMIAAYRKREQLLNRLVNEKREWVYLVALSGDEHLTRDEMQTFSDSVPQRFIPAGWEEFVLGLCAFENSDYEIAAKHFELSNQENPSIAAEAMLARTNAQLGHYDEFVNTVLRLTASPPVSSDDCLFLARAVRWTGNFGTAKDYLDRHSAGFADRPSSSILERMIRLSVDANLAQEARDCNEADRLAFEFDKMRKLVPGSLQLREETIVNHVWAYRLLNRANRPSDAQEHFEAVMRIAPLVLASEQDHRGTHQLASFYEDVGDIEKATNYWQRADAIVRARHPDKQSGDFEYPYFLLRQREYDSAMEASQGEVVFILPHVMAMLGIQDADPQTYMDARWNEAPKGLTPRLMLVASLYLSGDTSKAQSLAGRFLERQPEGTSKLESEEVLNSVLRYYAGDEKHSTDLIDLSENASDSELLAGVFVALRLVGEGDPADRAEAKRLAQKAFDNSGTYFTYTLSRTLLALLQDRNWPRVDRQ